MNRPAPPRVLIVDDNDLTRSALHLMLSHDFEVVGEATNCRSGLAMCLKERPDIVCLDIQLPDGNGLDILASIKDALPATAVLMVTASNDLDTIKSAIARGAAGFILKPFTPGTVHDAMLKAVASLKRPHQGA